MGQGQQIARYVQSLKKSKEARRVWLTASGVTGCMILLRFLGWLQSAELAALDQMFRIRPVEPPDERIVIVEIDDNDINQIGAWPIPDEVLATALNRIKSYQPRAIGLDIYRELPVEPGHKQLLQVLEATPNLIGIEKVPDVYSIGVRPPSILAEKQQIGFNNVLVDADSRVRRSLLFWSVNDEEHKQSFALSLALLYLKAENISPRSAPHSQELQLGEAIFQQLQPNDGGYAGVDDGGYQILANFRSPRSRFPTVSLTDLLNGDLKDPNLMRDRIVLIGSTANSLKDFFYTSYSSDSRPIAGVELHAQIVSQIISAALDDRPLIRVVPDPTEWLWIYLWALVGASLSWKLRSPSRAGGGLLVAGGLLVGTGYGAFLLGWWIPVVPPLVGLVMSAIAITSYIAHLEGELQKSKEFLHSVINAIPDPIFVKDKQHRWIVLNEAYSKFIGYPIETLINQSEYTFLSEQQASLLRQHDDLAFQTGIEQESEGELTNASGHTYQIATKRSLHRDGAGNLFLVGVIRDITHRKRMEEELRRTAAELVRSNAELRQTGNQLRHIAYHDPLTGLPNRKLFQERLIQAIEWAAQNRQLIGLLFLDLDGFKSVNDTLGHPIGDLLLKAVAQRLTGCLRASDTVARLGGDEFVVILPAIPSADHISTVAEKILMTLSKPFLLEDKAISITTSIGVSIYPEHGESMEILIVAADQAMYRAKEHGKNRYEFTQAEPFSQLTNGAIAAKEPHDPDPSTPTNQAASVELPISQ
ncbi:MAG: CHASE2 domain-containing protein [Synechococcales bacterium]|nr:CHASE2 domain-containing protein [Synechococcales bacterium]